MALTEECSNEKCWCLKWRASINVHEDWEAEEQRIVSETQEDDRQLLMFG